MAGWASDGQRSVVIPGIPSTRGALSQIVTVPAWAERATMLFDWYMTSAEGTTYQYDALYVSVSGVNTLEQLGGGAIWNTAPRGTWYTARAVVSNVANYRGQPIGVMFAGFNDATNVTTWYVDNVRLYFMCGSYQADEADRSTRLNYGL
jgi:hypothetical protein